MMPNYNPSAGGPNHHPKAKAFSVMEVIIAITIVGLVSSACLSLLATSFRINRNIRNSLVASGLAQEGIEFVRSLRDSNWLAGKTADGTTCTLGTTQWRENLCQGVYVMDYTDTILQNDSSLLYRSTAAATQGFYVRTSTDNMATPFRREITISNSADDGSTVQYEPNIEFVVSVRVYWCRQGNQPCPASDENVLYVEEKFRNWLGS